jgi:hypothetical protein
MVGPIPTKPLDAFRLDFAAPDGLERFVRTRRLGIGTELMQQVLGAERLSVVRPDSLPDLLHERGFRCGEFLRECLLGAFGVARGFGLSVFGWHDELAYHNVKSPAP